jgi:hypothetical protein
MTASENDPSSIQTEEKKQHFDDIYVAETPVPFKERIIDALDYVSDDFNRRAFDRLVFPWCERKAKVDEPLRYVDLCCCFGNTTMAVLHGMDVEEIRANWADERSAEAIARPRRFPCHATGIDISANAVDYGTRTGLFDEGITADLNAPPPELREAVHAALRNADVLVSTASLVYLQPEAIAALLDAFAAVGREGYLMVNFLNPFALEKADATKRLLLERFDFVGSEATRHRRLSALERENYPGEDWALLEIWTLKRRT